MSQLQFLKDCCENLEQLLQTQEMLDKKLITSKVTCFSGLKEAGYYVPRFVTTKMALSGDADKIEMAWFVEIFVNGDCIFRESYIPRESEDLLIVQEMVINKVLKSVFAYGVMSSKQGIEKMRSLHS